MKLLWEILAFLTTFKIFPFGPVAHYNETILRNSRISHHLQNLSSGQVAHYNKITLKNLCIFHHFENLHVFHLGRSPIKTRPLWKIFVFFTSLKNLCVFHLGRSPIITRPLWKIFLFFITLKNLGRSSITTSPLWKISVFFTILKKSPKNLCIFHPGRSPITIRPSQKTFLIFSE